MGKLKYAIIGTGALGGYYGGKLAKAGEEVHFLLNSDYEYVKKHGLKIDSVKGNFALENINAYASVSEMPACDVILVCLKTTNNHLLNTLLPSITHKNSLVILVQNGLGFEQRLANAFPDLAIAGGLAFICSSKIGPGHIGHFDFGSITFGGFQKVDHAMLEQICTDFTQAGVKAFFSDDLNLARWRKLVWNIPYNGMTVVLNTTTDALMNQADSRKLIRDLMTEVVEAANACNAKIESDFVDKMLESTDKMTPYAPSMKLDFDARRKLEIEAIYSNPLNEAGKAGYAMKKVALLEQQLHFIENQYLKN